MSVIKKKNWDDKIVLSKIDGMLSKFDDGELFVEEVFSENILFDDNKVKNILKAITNDGIIRASLSSYDKVDTLIANKNGFFEDAYMLPEEPFDADHLLYVFSEAFMTLTVQNKYLDLMKSNSSDGSGPSQSQIKGSLFLKNTELPSPEGYGPKNT